MQSRPAPQSLAVWVTWVYELDHIAIRLEIRDPAKTSIRYDNKDEHRQRIFHCESGCRQAHSGLVQKLGSCYALTYLVQSSLGGEDRDLVVVV